MVDASTPKESSAPPTAESAKVPPHRRPKKKPPAKPASLPKCDGDRLRTLCFGAGVNVRTVKGAFQKTAKLDTEEALLKGVFAFLDGDIVHIFGAYEGGAYDSDRKPGRLTSHISKFDYVEVW